MSVSMIRRNIHTYPFKYRRLEPEAFFRPDPAVIYIHVPFCSTKCHFCEYTVYVDKPADVQERYVRAVCAEIERFAADRTFPQHEIEAVYIGGGTPGILTSEQLARLVDACRRSYRFTPDCEVCVEFDPGCVTNEKLAALHEAGVNRVSVGVQTFDDELLRRCNRPHDRRDVERAFDCLRRAPFTHVNVDLIYPLPGLTLATWMDSVKRTLEFGSSCITIYGLEVWPGTAYHNWMERGKLELPAASAEEEMYVHAMDALEAAGYVAGSTSGYYHPERTRRYCRFLDFYWRTWPMLGFGVSSKSLVGDRHWTNIKPINEYMERIEAGAPVLDLATTMTKPQEMRRVMIRGLKMCSVDKADFLTRFGVPMEMVFGKQIEALLSGGLVEIDASSVRLTKRGRGLSNNVYECFYDPEDLSPLQPGEVRYGISSLVTE